MVGWRGSVNLNVLAAVAGDQDLAPSTGMGQHITAHNPNSKGSNVLFWPPEASAHMCIQTHTQINKYSFIHLFKKKDCPRKTLSHPSSRGVISAGGHGLT